MQIELTEKNRRDLFTLVRSVIEKKLRISPAADESSCDFSDPVFSRELGAFVTLHIHGSLRGCIGYIEGVLPLTGTIRELAVSAAFRDPRFNPLSADEYASVDLEISILSPIEPLGSFADIVIGRDGLIARKRGRSGLLLPQVASEYGWSVEEFLSHTCGKAGLSPDEWRDGSVQFEKFSAYVFGEKDLS
jgi:AmmeMemoRadiSam system protein A